MTKSVFERLYDRAHEQLVQTAQARGKAIALIEGTIRSLDAYISVYLDFDLDHDKRTIKHLQAQKEELQEAVRVLRMDE